MVRPPTAAQRRVIEGADPVTGRLKGSEAQLAALVKRGLAFRHARPPHNHFLTPAGHRVRDAGVQAGIEQDAPPSGTPGAPGAPGAPGVPEIPGPAGSGPFVARAGGEEGTPTGGAARRREVRSAWQGLLELRRMTNTDGATERPCGWERANLVRAAALALEAAGHRPAGPDGDGYRVRATPQPDSVAVHGPDGTTLRDCAATLERAGWQAGEYTEPRSRVRYLLASPRRV
ncbi:hypothetical protein ABZ354_01010 [Streptomyces sp. NPDC005925]|uniref:hypothetical protein n=1 Tax=Streptomyces sp. NPDC005925 TaxID=3157172 RepID=UPI0033EE75B9